MFSKLLNVSMFCKAKDIVGAVFVVLICLIKLTWFVYLYTVNKWAVLSLTPCFRIKSVAYFDFWCDIHLQRMWYKVFHWVGFSSSTGVINII
jgi:hypothetical protein